MKITAIFAVIAAIVLIAFSCSNEGNGFLAKLLKGDGGSAVPVTVENVSVRDHAPKLNVTATLMASDSVDVTLPEEVTIDRVLVAEGDPVDAGDVLMRISEEDIQGQLAKVRIDLREAQATLDKNTYLDRNRDRLFDEGRLDRNQYDNIDVEVEKNEAQLEKFQLEIGRLEDRLGNTAVTSPIAGVVAKRQAGPGMTIPAGKPLATITKVDPIDVTFRLASHESTTIRPGMTIRVRFPDLVGETATARITNVDTTIDPKDNTFAVRAAIANSTGYFKVGMPAEVEFTSSKRQRFYMIPESALIRERRRYFVFTVIKGIAHKVQVVPNESRGDKIEIARGLREDDLVVVRGHDKLTEGSVVDIWGK